MHTLVLTWYECSHEAYLYVSESEPGQRKTKVPLIFPFPPSIDGPGRNLGSGVDEEK